MDNLQGSGCSVVLHFTLCSVAVLYSLRLPYLKHTTACLANPGSGVIFGHPWSASGQPPRPWFWCSSLVESAYPRGPRSESTLCIRIKERRIRVGFAPSCSVSSQSAFSTPMRLPRRSRNITRLYKSTLLVWICQ